MAKAKKTVIAYSRNEAGQFFYDLVLSDKSEKWLARKWKRRIVEIRDLRAVGKAAMKGRK